VSLPLIALGVVALFALGVLVIRRAVVQNPRSQDRVGVVLYTVIVVCLFGLLVVDLSWALRFIAFTVVFFLVFIVPVGLLVLRIRKKRGWDVT